MRLYRLLAIIMLLINRKRVTAGELAEYFEVSTRTIYRDLETINEAGIPLVAYQGPDGGYSIMENYKLDRNLFTPREILSILTALEGLNSSMEDRAIKDITEKVKALFPEIEGDDKYRYPVVMDLTPWGSNQETKNKLEMIRQTITEKRMVNIKYISSKKELIKREIEPISLLIKGATWYLYAFCRLRQDYRIFRLSRIKSIDLLNKKYTALHKSYREFEGENSWAKNTKEVELELLFKPEAIIHIQDYFAEEQIEEKEDGSYLARVSFPEDEWVYGFILSFGDLVEVINPPYIRDIIQEKARGILNQY
ncbi:MAG TPA: YafY family protein [Halanaerobiales bacterium]|nr:YafY family protein [Halanaerobiales bacterium]